VPHVKYSEVLNKYLVICRKSRRFQSKSVGPLDTSIDMLFRQKNYFLYGSTLTGPYYIEITPVTRVTPPIPRANFMKSISLRRAKHGALKFKNNFLHSKKNLI